jgi:hypothetical protein
LSFCPRKSLTTKDTKSHKRKPAFLCGPSCPLWFMPFRRIQVTAALTLHFSRACTRRTSPGIDRYLAFAGSTAWTAAALTALRHGCGSCASSTSRSPDPCAGSGEHAHAFSTLFSVCNEGVERIGDEKGLDKILPLSGNRVNRAFSGAAMEVASPAPRITFPADSASNPIGKCAKHRLRRGV